MTFLLRDYLTPLIPRDHYCIVSSRLFFKATIFFLDICGDIIAKEIYSPKDLRFDSHGNVWNSLETIF